MNRKWLVVGLFFTAVIHGVAAGLWAWRAQQHPATGQDEMVLELRFPLPTGYQPRITFGSEPTPPGLFDRGVPIRTGDPFDLAIDGIGFFSVVLPNAEPAYTRHGNFHLNAVGCLVNADGYLINPQITIPADAFAVTVGADGTVAAQTAGTAVASTVGQLTLTRFNNPRGLMRVTDGVWRETADSGPPTVCAPGISGAGFIRSGFLEYYPDDLLQRILDLVCQLPQRTDGQPQAVVNLRQSR